MHDLIQRYIEETVRHLPYKERLDVAQELEANIQDMLGGDESTEHVEQVLLSLGSPVELANQYRTEARYLIGPESFDLYLMVLKIVALVVGIVTMVLSIIPMFFSTELTTIPEMVAQVISTVASGLSGAFFWVTIIFAGLSRAQVNMKTEWNKKALYELEKVENAEVKRAEPIAELIGISFFFVFLAILYRKPEMIAIFRTGFDPIPLFLAQQIRPYVIGWIIVGILSSSLTILKLIKRRWTTGLFIYNIAVDIVGMVYFIFLSTRWKIYNPEIVTFIPKGMAGLQAIVKAACTVLVILTALGQADTFWRYFKRTLPNASVKAPAR